MFHGVHLLRSAQMRAMEDAAMAAGAATGDMLMARAGRAAAGHLRAQWPKARPVTVLAGPGNNGGDGLVIAQALHRAGWAVRVMAADLRDGAALAAWRALGPVAPLDPRAIDPAHLQVDALFGTGLSRPPAGPFAAVIDALRGCPDIMAVDAPSGLCMDSGRILGPHAPRAALTVAFDSPRPGHLLAYGPAHVGRLVVADIGLHAWRDAAPGPATTAIWPRFGAGPMIEAAWLRKAAGGDHKYAHGAVLVVAGEVAGAARLAARSALRVGAGLVTLAPSRAAMADHAGPPDALMRRAVDDADALAHAIEGRITALVLGPGAGVDRAAALLPAALAARIPAVLDADALTALARDGGRALHDGCILTPHPGEFARLAPDLAQRLRGAPDSGPAFSRLDAVRAAAARLGAVVLLKGPDTVVAAPDGRAAVHSAFDLPWLATAGAGDALAGLIAGLAARGLSPFDAACLGARLHAQAARAFGPGMIADDIPDTLPAVIAEWDG